MIQNIQLRVSIKEEKLDGILVLKSAQQLGISKNEITAIKVLRKSIDARKSLIFFNYKVAVYIQEKPSDTPEYIFEPMESAQT